ncbi:MAG: OmpA family protein [Verrucomicrobia bacterium]|nr:OmpA family protein [Cytophagales bacterium]
MKKNVCLLIFLCLTLGEVYAQVITENPRIDQELKTNSMTLRIQRVEITDEATVFYCEAVNLTRINLFSQFYLNVKPDAVIIAAGGRKTYRFLRSTGIPVAPAMYKFKRLNEIISFQVYFEKLDPGVEVFDLFECQNTDAEICFNYYGIHVRNPENAAPVTFNKTPGAERTETKPVPAKPKVTIKGKVFNSQTQQPLSALVLLETLPGNKALATLQTDPRTGTYIYTFTPDKKSYGYTASARGYIAVQENLDFSDITENQTIIKDIYLKPIEVGKPIRLEKIYFAQGEYTLLTSSFAELDKLVKLMQDNPTMEILLEGHTDIIGNPVDNQTLSENRVKNVKDYLVKKSISGIRIQTKAYGGNKPIVAQGSDEERKINRRVEFTVLKK